MSTGYWQTFSSAPREKARVSRTHSDHMRLLGHYAELVN